MRSIVERQEVLAGNDKMMQEEISQNLNKGCTIIYVAIAGAFDRGS